MDPYISEGKEKVIWLHTASKRHWAILHTAKRHGIDLDAIAILEVHVPRGKLKRRWRGLWTTHETLTDFISITDGASFAESPIS